MQRGSPPGWANGQRRGDRWGGEARRAATALTARPVRSTCGTGAQLVETAAGPAGADVPSRMLNGRAAAPPLRAGVARDPAHLPASPQLPRPPSGTRAPIRGFPY
ncbi:hypothetical protein GCM10027174_38380 [Salinifilum aidingensis]